MVLEAPPMVEFQMILRRIKTAEIYGNAFILANYSQTHLFSLIS